MGRVRRALGALVAGMVVAAGGAAWPAGGATGADFAVTIEAPASVPLGGAFTASIVVGNLGDAGGTVPPVVVAASTPSVSPPAGADWTCDRTMPDSPWFLCASTASLAAGGTAAALTLSFGADPDAAYYSISVWIGTGDGNSANDSAGWWVFVERPDLAISALTDATRVEPGQAAGVDVRVTNVGAFAAGGAVLLTVEQSGYTAVSAAGAGWACGGVSPLVCNLGGGIQPGSATTLRVTARAGGGPQGVIALRVSHPDDLRPANDEARVAVQIGPVPDLGVTVEPLGSYFAPGRLANHRVVITNDGDAPTSVPVTVDAGSFELSDFRASGSGWDCRRPEPEQLLCRHGTLLAPGASLPALYVKGGALGEWGESVDTYVQVATAADLNPSNDLETTSTPIAPPIGLEVDVTDGDATTVVGGPVSFSAVVRNIGIERSFGVIEVVYSVLGADLTASGTNWSCVAASCTYDGNVPAESALPPLVLSGLATGEVGTEIVADAALFNESDETIDDDTDAETMPILPGTFAGPRVSVDDARVIEPDERSTRMAFRVHLSQDVAQKVRVKYTTFDGSATNRVDYSRRAGTVTFQPGEREKTVLVTVKGDVVAEAHETFELHLYEVSGGPMLEDSAATGTILDLDPPSVTIGDVTVIEGTGSNKAATFVLLLSAAPTETVRVKWATVARSATESSDFGRASGTVSWGAGETVKTVKVTVKGDALDESTEQFRVVLSAPQGVRIADPYAVGTIVDDD